MTDILSLARTLEAAKASGRDITISAADLAGLLRLASAMGDGSSALASLGDALTRMSEPAPAITAEPDNDTLLTINDICSRLGISRMTLYSMRRAGKFIEPVKRSARGVGWNPQDFQAWKAARQVRRP